MIQKLINICFATLFLVAVLSAQSTKPRVFYLGHSLINFEIPNMVNKLTQDAKLNLHYQAHIGNGANFSWHWTQPQSGQGDLWDTTLRNQVFDKFILTEAIALKGHLKWSNTYGYLDSFYNYAAKKSPAIKMYIYETWHCINSGTPTKCMYDDDSHLPWRERLDLDRPLWEGIADHLNMRLPNTAFMIPGGQGIAKLHDAILAGKMPGMTSSRSLFQDDIHLTNVGNYFIACIMYSVIHQRSPEGLKNRLEDNWGQLYEVFPTIDQAKFLQKLAWETVCGYSRTGFTCSTSVEENDVINKHEFYKNGDILFSKNHVQYDAIRLLDLTGRQITHTNKSSSLHLTQHIASGIYLIDTEINGAKFGSKIYIEE
jgi:hypothetical protein